MMKKLIKKMRERKKINILYISYYLFFKIL